MRINCWHEIGRKNASKDVIRVRNVPAAQQKELRAAIRAARAGEGDGLLYEIDRGYSDRGRVLARLAVGVGVVVVMITAVSAFVAPDSANTILGLGLIPGAMVAGFTALFSFTHDTGVGVHADGTLRAEGWGGVRVVDLRSFARVTVAEDPVDDASWIGG